MIKHFYLDWNVLNTYIELGWYNPCPLKAINFIFAVFFLDIAVNAVATAVKDFFFKRLPPLLPTEHMDDLESIASMQVSLH